MHAVGCSLCEEVFGSHEDLELHHHQVHGGATTQEGAVLTQQIEKTTPGPIVGQQMDPEGAIEQEMNAAASMAEAAHKADEQSFVVEQQIPDGRNSIDENVYFIDM